MGEKSSKVYIGMDVHKASIDIAVAEESGEVRHQGQIAGDMNALWRAVRMLESTGRKLVFVYEAGPCGFGIYRGLIARGHECWLVAPSNIPRRVRDRIKTDRRDVQAVEEATVRVAQLGHYLEQEVAHWRWLPVVNALQACRGIQLVNRNKIVVAIARELAGFVWAIGQRVKPV